MLLLPMNANAKGAWISINCSVIMKKMMLNF